MRQSLFFSLILLLVFCSCQKELDIDLGNPPPPPGSTNDSIYISAYIEFDSTLPPGQDTTLVTHYFYDNQKRITHFAWVEMYGSTQAGPTRPGSIKYYYNGNDTLPYKLTATSGDNGVPAIFDTVYFTYAASGLVSRDSGWTFLASTNARTSAFVTKFSGSGNNITVTEYWTDYNILPPVTDTTTELVHLLFSGQEIIQQTAPSNLVGYEFFQMSYTDHPDPLYRIDIHYPVYNYFGWGTSSAKKLLVTQDVGSGQPNTIWAKNRWSYEYRVDGYPVVSRASDLLDPTYHYKYHYIYTHL